MTQPRKRAPQRKRGGGGGKAKPVDHLAWTQPSQIIHRMLRHVGQYRVGPIEGDDGGLAEEPSFPRYDVVAAEPEYAAISGPTHSTRHATVVRTAGFHLGARWWARPFSTIRSIT